MYELLVKIMADWLVIVVVIIAGLTLLIKVPNTSRLAVYKRILMAGLTSYLAAKLIGAVYQPELERPFEIIGVAAGASFLNNPGFPSDHILFVTAILWAVWFETRQKVVSIILAVLVVLIAVGRVLALVHSVEDVVGGLVIGSAGIIWYTVLRPSKSKK